MRKDGTRKIAVLGATGSIGRSAIEVIENNRDRFSVSALAVNKRWEPLLPLIEQFSPGIVAVSDSDAARQLRARLEPGCGVEVVDGEGALEKAACADGTDMCLCACSGAVGLSSALAAVRAGIDLALANKEVLVAGGELLTAEVKKSGVAVLPVDSEHSAVFQCIRDEAEWVDEIVLTASGGPFRGYGADELAAVTVSDALRHPNWEMGRKITIDSATLMNKGLEVIEAHWLFGVDYERIKVVVHPESVIHSMVVFRDCSVLAQLGVPDMKLPIQYAFSHPERIDAPYLRKLDLVGCGTLSFEEPDYDNFPCLRLAYEAGRTGGTLPAAMNAANEVAVHAFLEGRIGFRDIPCLVEDCMNEHAGSDARSLEAVLSADAWGRERARLWMRKRGMV